MIPSPDFPMRRFRRWGVCSLALVAVVLAGAPLRAQDGSVRVVSARANIRAEASETSTVLTQVTSGTLLQLIAVEGEWFHVRLPADPRLGGARVDAYISKKVAKLETAAVAPPPVAATPAPGKGTEPIAIGPPPPPATVAGRDGMSVALVAGDTTTWMAPATVRIIRVPDKVEALSKLAATLTSTAGAPVSSDGGSQTTYVWVVDGAAGKPLADKRPSFLVQFKEVPGVSPDDLIPVLVRLVPAASDGRLVAALRGRSDQAARLEAEWDVFKDLKQEIVRSDTTSMARGITRIQPSGDLAPGEYAVVVRLLNRRKVAGATLLHNEAEGRAFGVVWDFAIK